MKELTVIISAHNQGQFLYRTIRSLCLNKEELNEIIVVLDTPTEETRNYAEISAQRFPSVKIIETKLRDIGLSRNKGAVIAKGSFILFLDAGDIILMESIKKLLLAAKDNSQYIYVPIYSVKFDSDKQIVEKHESTQSFSHAKTLLFIRNPWESVFLISKEVFLGNPYKGDDKKYNIDNYNKAFWEEHIIRKGQILVVPETAVFIRNIEKNFFLQDNCISGPTELFDYFEQSKIDITTRNEIKSVSFLSNFITTTKGVNDNRPILKRIFSVLFPNFYLNLFKLKEHLLRRVRRITDAYPVWFLSQWEKANEYDDLVFPISYGTSDIWYHYKNSLVAYYDYLKTRFPQRLDYLVMCPWLKSGGADKLTLSLVRGIAELYPESKIGLIITEPVVSEIPTDLPSNIEIVELGRLTANLEDKEREMLLLRFLVQTSAKHLINVNSHLMYQVLMRYRSSLRKYSKMYCFCFSAGKDTRGQYSGYAFEYIPYVIDSVEYILTDNKNIINFLHEHYGLDDKKFKCIYQPVLEYKERQFNEDKEVIDILWGSRIDPEKLPEVLEGIVKKSNSNMQFHIYGKSVLGGTFKIEQISQYKNAKYYGGYSGGMKNIPDKDYDIYLYTSAFDGMPNSVLEAIALGIPVIASNIGGIHEVIEDRKSGLLVNEFRDADQYIAKIQKLLNSRNLLKSYASNAQKNLKNQHSWNSYIDNLKTIFK